MAAQQHNYTVGELNKIIEIHLKDKFAGSINVEGEVSNFSRASSGHWYFTLKEADTQIQAVMFKGYNTGVQKTPANGDKIQVTGEIAFYKARGQCQIICHYIIPLGEGAILAHLEKLKKKLYAEGLFDEERKKNIPPLPQRIGIISSRNAAAYEDIKRTFINHNIPAHIFLFHCAVQGDTAKNEIAAQIQYANKKHPYLDVLLLSRGGGSVEDLLAFSEEPVIYAIANSSIPIISGVGHEIDTPLCELAADIRAHTPTDAAEIICKTIITTIEKIETYRTNINDLVQDVISNQKQLITQFSPEPLITYFLRRTASIRQKIDDIIQNIESTVINKKDRIKNHIFHIQKILEEGSPEKILSKGYSIIYDEDKKNIIRSVKNLQKNKKITLVVRDGEKSAIINEE